MPAGRNYEHMQYCDFRPTNAEVLSEPSLLNIYKGCHEHICRNNNNLQARLSAAPELAININISIHGPKIMPLKMKLPGIDTGTRVSVAMKNRRSCSWAWNCGESRSMKTSAWRLRPWKRRYSACQKYCCEHCVSERPSRQILRHVIIGKRKHRKKISWKWRTRTANGLHNKAKRKYEKLICVEREMEARKVNMKYQ